METQALSAETRAGSRLDKAISRIVMKECVTISQRSISELDQSATMGSLVLDFLIHSPNLYPRTALLTLSLESAEVQRNRYHVSHKGSESSNVCELDRLRSPNTLEV